MNDLQKIEFELFLCLDEICEKLNINYFLLCGSALGAVRHGGFIPWDDDLDVGMYREDYNKFIKLAPSMLPKNIFLQNYQSDPSAPFLCSKLRNSDTAFIEKSISDFKINHGIYIDIFPLDGYPKKSFEQKKVSILSKIYRLLIYCGVDMNYRFKTKLLISMLRFFGFHKRTAKTIARCEALISKYSVNESSVICSHTNRYGKRDYMPMEYYGNGTYAEFEGKKVRIPEKYEEYLTRLYGDWRTPPPAEEQKSVHPSIICDTEKSYTHYIKDFSKTNK